MCGFMLRRELRNALETRRKYKGGCYEQQLGAGLHTILIILIELPIGKGTQGGVAYERI
jgi:hypothetical protein